MGEIKPPGALPSLGFDQAGLESRECVSAPQTPGSSLPLKSSGTMRVLSFLLWTSRSQWKAVGIRVRLIQMMLQ